MTDQTAFTAEKINFEGGKMEEKDIFEDSAINLSQGDVNISIDGSEGDEVEIEASGKVTEIIETDVEMNVAEEKVEQNREVETEGGRRAEIGRDEKTREDTKDNWYQAMMEFLVKMNKEKTERVSNEIKTGLELGARRRR